MEFLNKKMRLVGAVSKIDLVRAIGQTGDISEVPQPGRGDIDLFVFCDDIPSERARSEAYDACASMLSERRMTICEDGHWGTEDALVVDGLELYFMYFTIHGMKRYLNDVLAGKYPDREGSFYPVGRLATIHTIHALYDEGGVLAALKDTVREYPEALSRMLSDYHFARIIDEEDLDRAVSRRDVLFYHMVLEESLDHFLQALFALNKVYFPSRKRTEQYMAAFARIPQDCCARILRVIEEGSCGGTIARSVGQWRKLAEELGKLR